MDLNSQYKQLLTRLYPDKYVDLSQAPTAVTIALEDMEYDGLIEAESSGSLHYRLTPKGEQAKKEGKMPA